MATAIVAAVISVAGLLLGGSVALAPLAVLVFGALHLRRRLRGATEPDPTDAEHLQHAVLVELAGAVGVAAAL